MPALSTGCSTESPPLASMQSLSLRLLRALLVTLLAIAGAFAAGVVWYHAPSGKLGNAILALAWFAFALACAVTFARDRDWRAISAFAFPFMAILVWFVLIAPSNDRVWSPEMARL